MSTRSGVIHSTHPVGLQVWLAVIVALVLTATVALGISSLDRSSDTIAPALPASAHVIDAATADPVEGTRGAHGPNQIPKQFTARDYDIRPHGPNQMPKGH